MAPRLVAFGMAEDEMSFICVFSLHHGRYGRSACPRLQGEDVADWKARWSQHRLCCLAQGSLPVRAASLTYTQAGSSRLYAGRAVSEGFIFTVGSGAARAIVTGRRS
jgi:hypothetical protein